MNKLLKSPSCLLGILILAVLTLLAVFGPILSQADPLAMQVSARYQAPGPGSIMGTDEFGRDVFVRVLYGARASLGLAFAVALTASAIGLLLGIYAPVNRVSDQVLMRFCDGLAAIPGILLAIALMAVLGSSLTNAYLALSIVYVPGVARIVRSLALGVYGSASIEALRLQGARLTRIVWIHVAPQLAFALIVQTAFVFAEAILAEAALSFLGIGVSPPMASWGNMIYAGKAVIDKAWWLTLFPGLMIALSVVSLQLLGDGLRDLLDVRLVPRRRVSGRQPQTGAQAGLQAGAQAAGCSCGAGAEPLLRIRDLRIGFDDGGQAWPVDGVNLDLPAGTIIGIVGESGCGKSLTALSVLRLLDHTSPIKYSGEIVFGGRDLLALPPAALRRIRGNDIAMVFQDPMTSLHPLFSIGAQIAEALRLHGEKGRGHGGQRGSMHGDHLRRGQRQARGVRVEELLAQVGIDEPARRMRQYPHEFSGGMLQRAMIAMSLASDPSILIADEPTTALDTNTQAQILALFKNLCQERRSCLLISHDLAVVARVCSYVHVMYLGQIVEAAEASALFTAPRHPYTQGLLASIPPLTGSCGKRLATIAGQAEYRQGQGCRFAPRCPLARQRCFEQMPELLASAEPLADAACMAGAEPFASTGRMVRCFAVQEQWPIAIPADATSPAALAAKQATGRDGR
jgi:peptide/nickel transport system permease protein